MHASLCNQQLFKYITRTEKLEKNNESLLKENLLRMHCLHTKVFRRIGLRLA